MYYIFLIYFITTIKCTNVANLKQILSRKESVEWISGMEAPVSHSSYCNFCCINILAETIGKNCGSHTLCKYKVNIVYRKPDVIIINAFSGKRHRTFM